MATTLAAPHQPSAPVHPFSASIQEFLHALIPLYAGCQIFEELMERKREGLQWGITGEGKVQRGHDFEICMMLPWGTMSACRCNASAS